MKGLVAQLCPILCDLMDCSLPVPLSMGFPRILEWVAISFSRGSSQPRIEPASPALQTDSLPSEPAGNPECGKKLLSFFNSKDEL